MRRQQAAANRRNLRSLIRPDISVSIRFGSVQLNHSRSVIRTPWSPQGGRLQCSNSVKFLTPAHSGSDGTTAPLLFGISGREIEVVSRVGRKETAPATGNRERHSTAQRLIAYGCAFRPDQVHNCPLRGTPPGSLTRAPG